MHLVHDARIWGIPLLADSLATLTTSMARIVCLLRLNRSELIRLEGFESSIVAGVAGVKQQSYHVEYLYVQYVQYEGTECLTHDTPATNQWYASHTFKPHRHDRHYVCHGG